MTDTLLESTRVNNLDSEQSTRDVNPARISTASITIVAETSTPRHLESTTGSLEETAKSSDSSSMLSVDEAPPAVKYEVKQKWQGHVLEVGKDTFRARLSALEGEPGEHIAEIYLEEIDRTERESVEPGSVFYWTIGYRDTSAGRKRESRIRFQLLPRRSSVDILAAYQTGRELLELFGDD